MRRTVRADLETRTPDDQDRQRCSACGVLILDTFQEGHAVQHIERRDSSGPVKFEFVQGLTPQQMKERN